MSAPSDTELLEFLLRCPDAGLDWLWDDAIDLVADVDEAKDMMPFLKQALRNEMENQAKLAPRMVGERKEQC